MYRTCPEMTEETCGEFTQMVNIYLVAKPDIIVVMQINCTSIRK